MIKKNADDILICCPSYKRPRNVDTLKYLPKITVYVSESEALNYKKSNPGADIRTMPDKFQGNISRVRNWILDQNPDRVVCIVDDDLQSICYWEGQVKHTIADAQEFSRFVVKYTLVAMEMGTVLWGINVNNDPQCYREYTPFSTVSYVGAPFMVHIATDLRFDETLPLKEDYDFCLQVLSKYRKILRVNKFHYYTKQAGSSSGDRKGQAGGCATYRTLAAEREQLKRLQDKWGTKIVGIDSLENSRNHKSDKVRTFDINPIIRVPIQGV